MKIFCIGRNYLNHIKEMNADLPEFPLFFMKPDISLLKENTFYYPDFTKQLHYECEIVVRICKVGKNIEEKFAANYYQEINLGIDFTARDIQQECKEKGWPWEIAKSFENSAPIGKEFRPLNGKNIQNLNFRLDKNGKTVQTGNTENMIFKVDKIIAYLSQFMTLKIGDLIFTGTPEGVGEVQIGDHLEGFLENEKLLDLKIR